MRPRRHALRCPTGAMPDRGVMSTFVRTSWTPARPCSANREPVRSNRGIRRQPARREIARMDSFIAVAREIWSCLWRTAGIPPAPKILQPDALFECFWGGSRWRVAERPRMFGPYRCEPIPTWSARPSSYNRGECELAKSYSRDVHRTKRICHVSASVPPSIS